MFCAPETDGGMSRDRAFKYGSSARSGYGPLVKRLPRRVIVANAVGTLIGVIMGVVLFQAGETSGGVILIVAPLIGPPSSVLIQAWSLKRRHDQH